MDGSETAVATLARAMPSLSAPAARRLAWSLWAIAFALATAGLLLAALNRLTLERLFAEYVVSQTAAALAFATVGLLITTRRAGHPIGWLFCATGIGVGWTGLALQYTRYALVTHPGSLPGAHVVAWLNVWTWIPVMMLALLFLPLLFPDGRLPSRRWRPALWLGVAATALVSIVLAFKPGPADASLPEVSNPFALEGAARLLDALRPAAMLLLIASLAIAVAAQVARFRHARGDERLQLKWFGAATVLLVAAFLTPIALDPTGFNDPVTGSTLLSGILLALALPSLPAAAGVAILRYRLYDIDLIIGRTLVYGALTAMVVGVYVFVVGYLSAIVRTGSDLLASLVATGIVAVLAAPVRERLQRGVDRLLYGERDDPDAALARLGRRLEATLAPDAVLPVIVGTVREALRLSYAAVALPAGLGTEIAAASGEPSPDALRLPLSYQGETVGHLLVGPRGPGESFNAADRRVLDDLASQAGVAVHGVRVTRDLQRVREQLVLAREEERRRLRRDLHDDLAPTLAALGLTAATVGQLIPSDPARAAAVNAKLESALRAAVGSVRRLVYDLRPPALDELGLVEAVRERSEQYGGPTAELRVRVEVPQPLPPLPAAVEVAAYRMVQEALNNVARHARARTCVVRLRCADDRWLQVEVIDDGIGVGADHAVGVGLRSMEERASELGGDHSVERLAPSGTRVSVRLPIRPIARTA